MLLRESGLGDDKHFFNSTDGTCGHIGQKHPCLYLPTGSAGTGIGPRCSVMNLVDVASNSFDFRGTFEQESWGFKSTAILVTLFMSLYSSEPGYMNWLLRDAYYFLNSSYSSACRATRDKGFLQQEDFWASWLKVYLDSSGCSSLSLIVGWVLADKRWG